jgi:hypothetical protein
MKVFLSHWKTSLNGILAFLITSLTIVSGFLGSTDVTNGVGIHASTKIAVGITVALALCRAWVGLLQQDSGTVLAVTPQSPIVPVPVPAHEIPDNPQAIPVVPKEI